MNTGRKCRYCRHLLRRGGRFDKRHAYACTAPVTDPPVPESLTKAYSFIPLSKQSRSYMSPDDGANCPAWEERVD